MKTITAVSAFALLIGATAATTAYAADVYSHNSFKDAPPVVAPVDPIFMANNQLAIQFVTTDFDYAEHLPNGTLFDTEKGWVPGIGAELTMMNNFIVPNFYLDLQFSYLTGQTDYVGGYTGRNPTPYGSVVAKSGADVYDFDSRIGKGFSVAPSFMVTPYLGVGYHEWDRGVNDGELYSHAYVGGGLLLQWAPTSQLVISANGLVGTTFSSHITVNGPLGIDAALGDSLLWKAGGGIDYALTPNWHVSGKAEWTEFDYGHSADYRVGNYIVSEPDSHTSNLTVKAGLGYSWASYTPLK